MQFFEWQSHVMRHHHPVKFSVHRTYANDDITFFICDETTYDYVTKELRDFDRGGPIS